MLIGAAAAAEPKILNLDPDQNGLYDDVERKGLLEAIQRIAPELTGPFDLDGGGKVTVREQESEGRRPTSTVILAENLVRQANRTECPVRGP